MAMENEEKPNASAYEVEMAETKQAAVLSPSTPWNHDLDIWFGDWAGICLFLLVKNSFIIIIGTVFLLN